MNATTNKTIYLVTGAAGFLGGTICRQLVERGEKVRAFVLPNDKAIKFIPSEVEIVEGDLCDIHSLEKLFTVPEGYETIVMHIASIVTVNPDYNQKVMDVNVGGTQNIIDLCLLHKECKKLVYCSSTGAIPELPKGTAIAETYDFDTEKVVGCYSQSKALATKAVLDAVKTQGLNACVVHPSGILGPEDFAIGETTGTVIQIINGEMPAGIDGSFNLCDVRDLANGTILAGMLEKQAKKKGTKPLMTTFSVYNLARNNSFDSSKAKNELGYTTRSYEETLRDEIAWLKKEGKIA